MFRKNVMKNIDSLWTGERKQEYRERMKEMRTAEQNGTETVVNVTQSNSLGGKIIIFLVI